MNKLVDELASLTIAQFDAELHFRALPKNGDPEHGLKVLDKLDKAFGMKTVTNNESK